MDKTEFKQFAIIIVIAAIFIVGFSTMRVFENNKDKNTKAIRQLDSMILVHKLDSLTIINCKR